MFLNIFISMLKDIENNKPIDFDSLQNIKYMK